MLNLVQSFSKIYHIKNISGLRLNPKNYEPEHRGLSKSKMRRHFLENGRHRVYIYLAITEIKILCQRKLIK